MKLKINKNYIKESGTKGKNQNNKEWNWNDNNKEGQAVIFKLGQRKKKVYGQQTRISLPTLVPPLKRKRNDTSNNIIKKYIFFFLLYRETLYTPLRWHRSEDMDNFHMQESALHALLPFIYIFDWVSNFLLAKHVIKKKLLWEDEKALWH
jgi:hypothetical protein